MLKKRKSWHAGELACNPKVGGRSLEAHWTYATWWSSRSRTDPTSNGSPTAPEEWRPRLSPDLRKPVLAGIHCAPPSSILSEHLVTLEQQWCGF